MLLEERPTRAAPAQLIEPAVVAVLAIAVVAFVLRWACIHQSLFGDELFLYTRVHGQSFGKMLSLVHDNENTPPLFFIVTWLFAKGSDPTLLVRIPSLLANVGLIFLIFALGRRVFGTAPALLAAAFFAISPFQIFYGVEDRAYSFVALLVMVTTLALLAALKQGDSRRPWVIYAVAAIAALYTHYISLLVLVPQAAWGLWTHRASIRRQLLWQGLIVLAALPWIPFFVLQARHSARESGRLSTLSPFTASNVVKTEVQSLIGSPYTGPGSLPGVVPLIVLGAALCMLILWRSGNGGETVAKWSGLSPSFASWRAAGGTKIAPRLRRLAATERGLILLLAIFPLIGLVIYSIRPHTSLLLPRNLEVAAPYAALVFGWLLVRPPPPWRWIIAALAFGALAVGTVKTLMPGFQRPDGHAAARFIDSRANAEATVIDFPGPQGTQIYFRRPHHVLVAGRFDWQAAASRHTQLFITALSKAPCSAAQPFYRLASSASWPSTPPRIVVCEYLPGAQR